MKDEIKEILDYLKIENGTIGSELSYEETHLLLDYITNLQEENKKLKSSLKDRLKYSEELDEVLDRNEKAIEYIENTYKDYKNEDGSLPLTLHDQELLKILQGEYKDE